MDRQQAKEKIKKRIARYNNLSEAEKRAYNEQQTKDHFIRPLFEALGWDFENDVWAETNVSKKRGDYAFKVNGIIKFFVEAKQLSVDIDELKWAEQAIWYAWHKSVPWAILTDFEGLKVYNAEWDEQDPERNLVLDLKYSDYLTDDRLWWLSKESMEKGELDKYAEENYKKPKRASVDKQLVADLLHWRDKLFNDFKGYNPSIKEEKISENVQRFLNRLIFIRTCEDRGFEDRVLQEAVRNWEERGYQNNELVKNLRRIFDYFDKTYDSKLFEEKIGFDSEKFIVDDNILAEVIKETYKGSKGIRWNFDDIKDDILGNIYEQYLGFVQKQEKGREKNNKSKRKSQGIYYTPEYIVSYIIQNTLAEVLKNKTEEEIKNIKILDPACGSGSFLIRAYRELIEYRQNQKNKENKFKKGTHLGQIEKTIKQKEGIKLLSSQEKMDILRNNIYGVDLDEKAVEIAQLNLLLKTVDKRMKLPNLQHILCGNSLISGREEELEKSFGKDWRDEKPFNWQEKFPEVFSQGGFDIVIGNPPYLKEMDNKDIFESIKKIEYKKYYQGKMDFWYFFLHRAIDVVKDGGFIGFITNSYFLKSEGASKLIERIKNELVLIKAVDLGDLKVFGDVSGRHMIHIYQKRPTQKIDKTILINISKNNFNNYIDEKNRKSIPFQELITDNKINFETTGTEANFKNCNSLGDIYDVSVGVQESTDKVSNKQVVVASDFKVGEGVFVLSKAEMEKMHLNTEEKKLIKKYLDISNIDKYFISFSDEYLIYSDKEAKQKISDGLHPSIKAHLDKMKKFITSSNKPYGLHRPRESKYFENPKLICKGMFLSPEFYYDEDKYYVGFSFSVIIQKDKNYNLKYLLGILNSEFAKNWFNANGKKRGVGVDIGVLVFRKFPVYLANKDQQLEIAELVDKMQELNQELQKLDPELDDKEHHEIKEQIAKTDKKIDEEVYKLYGLTGEEIKIIEKGR